MNSRPIDETYAETEKLVYYAVHRFRKRHGGDFDEMVSTANQVFMDSYEAYNAAFGSLSNFLITNITRRLIDERKGKQKQRAVSLSTPIGDGDLGDYIADRNQEGFDLEAFCGNLTEDARIVVKLVFDTPAELTAAADGRGGHYYNWRAAARVWLAENKGWAAKRIAEAFDEIADVLGQSNRAVS